jgi:hypothetical protein
MCSRSRGNGRHKLRRLVMAYHSNCLTHQLIVKSLLPNFLRAFAASVRQSTIPALRCYASRASNGGLTLVVARSHEWMIILLRGEPASTCPSFGAHVRGRRSMPQKQQRVRLQKFCTVLLDLVYVSDVHRKATKLARPASQRRER